jgi:hypothetical protein
VNKVNFLVTGETFSNNTSSEVVLWGQLKLNVIATDVFKDRQWCRSGPSRPCGMGRPPTVENTGVYFRFFRTVFPSSGIRQYSGRLLLDLGAILLIITGVRARLSSHGGGGPNWLFPLLG